MEKSRVTISHGNLTFARYPVAVGHYIGDPLQGPERHLDSCLDGRLSKRRDAGVYPGAIGTLEIVIDNEKLPPGAIVIGLGHYGELWAGKLSTSFEKAMLRFAFKVEEELDKSRDREHRTLDPSPKVCSLIIGHRGSRLTVRNCIDALLEGLIRANDKLGANRIAHLEFIELYEDTAIEAAAALNQLTSDERFKHQLDIDCLVGSTPGGLRRFEYGQQQDWWQRVQIRRADSANHGQRGEALKFTAFSEAAQSTELLLATQRDFVDRLLDTVRRDATTDQTIGRLLFEHLVPNPLKHFATDQRDILFLVDEAAAAYPLELLDDAFSGSAEPIAVRARVLRQFIHESDAEHSKASPIGNTALVVGDPDLSGSEMFPQLEGARREAEIVAELLARHKYETTKLIGAVGMDILSDLMLRANRIVHLAGHGVYHQEDSQTSGMVIGENHFLTPTLIGNMSHVPEFVFINCCHLGLTERLEDRQRADWLMRHKLAANLATQFIQTGAKAVIAAGWPVDDAAALTFARTLYESMMAGAALGPAVQEARKRTYRSHPDRNTWGAYQCYGDPEYTFHRDGRSHSPHERIHFVAPNQIVIAAEDLAQKIDTTNSANPEELKEELCALELDIKPDWLKHNSHILIAMGRAFGELGNFGKAVDYFEKALAAEKSEAPIRVIEQLANYRVRLAVESTRVGRESGDKKAIAECEQLIFEAIETVRKLDQLTLHASKKTREDDTLSMAERWSLLGSAYKRLSQVAIDRTTRNKALIKMETNYKCAHDMVGSHEFAADAYPTLNWLSARAVRSLRGTAKFTKEMREILSERATSGAARDRASPSYWNAIVRPEATVTMCLIDGTLDQHHRTILEDIKRAWLRGGSYRKASSVLEHFDFLIDVLGADNIRTKAKKRAELCSALITLRADISNLMGFSKDRYSGHGQT